MNPVRVPTLAVVSGLFAILLSACASAPIPAATSHYEKVITTGKPAAQSYDLTAKWIARNFESPKQLLKSGDKATGRFEGMAWVTLDESAVAVHEIGYQITIEVGDGATKLEFDTRYLLKTTFDMPRDVPWRDDPVANTVRLPVDEQSFQAFTQAMDKVAQSYESFLRS